MRKSLLGATVSITALTASFSPPAFAQTEADQQLGNVQFETSCNEVAQRRVDRAMRYQHSFWYQQTRDIFEEAAKADPACAIVHKDTAPTEIYTLSLHVAA